LLELIAPLTGLIGEKWLDGELAIFEEHIYTESLQQLLRQALQSIPRDALAERPRVVLTTLPGEQHGLGLLMVETMLALAGCQCLSLGVQTPLDELIRAANSHKADIVALSFTGILSTGMVQRSLGELRAQLPPGVALWAGGSSQALQRGSGLDGVRRVTALSAIAGEVSRWRAAQA
jgi:methanogenic corrinoid protein MtbC1